MFELIVIAAVMVFIVSRLDARHFEEAKSQWGLGAAPAETRRLPPPLNTGPQLCIDGTVSVPVAAFKYLKGFGMNPERLADVRVYAGAGHYTAFPAPIRELLGELHASGCALGTNVMELMFHARDLAQNEAVYFALVQDGGEPHVVAFVDRMRPA